MENNLNPKIIATFDLKGLSTQQSQKLLGVSTNNPSTLLKILDAAFLSVSFTRNEKNKNLLAIVQAEPEITVSEKDIICSQRVLTILYNKAKNNKVINSMLVERTITNVKTEKNYNNIGTNTGSYSSQIIDLDTINPLSFLGMNHKKLDLLKQNFSNAQIFSRGTQLKISADDVTMPKISSAVSSIISYITAHGDINEKHFVEILTTSNAPNFS